VIDWAIHVYVTKVNTTTGLSERVSNFKVRSRSFGSSLLLKRRRGVVASDEFQRRAGKL
jgi:hypothetical protein